MSKTIWKFDVLANIASIVMPRGSRIISTGLDPTGTLCVWAIVDPSEIDRVRRRIRVIYTNEYFDLPPGRCTFVGTVVTGPSVLHVFDLGEES